MTSVSSTSVPDSVPEKVNLESTERDEASDTEKETEDAVVIEEQEKKEGKFGDRFWNFLTNAFDPFKRPPGVLPKSVLDMMETMEKNGEDTITTMQIVRMPIEEYVTKLLQGLSRGRYRKAVKDSPYDRMFHLSIRLNGKYRLEKNEVISLYNAKEKLPKDAEFLRVVLPKDDAPITISSLLDKTRDYMGPLTFTDYNSRSNNCQDFVMAVLKANGLCTELLESFTLQDAETIFQGMPTRVSDIAETMTDLAAVLDKIKEGIKEEVDNLRNKK